VLKKKGDVLYERVSLLEESWLRDTVRVKVNQFVTSSIILGAAGESFAGQSTERRIGGERFMRELKDAFSDHQLCMGMITDVLMYMVRITFLPSLKIQFQSWDVGRGDSRRLLHCLLLSQAAY
jgi:cullin 3